MKKYIATGIIVMCCLVSFAQTNTDESSSTTPQPTVTNTVNTSHAQEASEKAPCCAKGSAKACCDKGSAKSKPCHKGMATHDDHSHHSGEAKKPSTE